MSVGTKNPVESAGTLVQVMTGRYLFILDQSLKIYTKIPVEHDKLSVDQRHFFPYFRYESWEIKDGQLFITTADGVTGGELRLCRQKEIDGS